MKSAQCDMRRVPDHGAWGLRRAFLGEWGVPFLLLCVVVFAEDDRRVLVPRFGEPMAVSTELTAATGGGADTFCG